MASMDGRLIHLVEGEWRSGETGSVIFPLGPLNERLTRVLRINDGEEFDAVDPGRVFMRLSARYHGRRLRDLPILSSRPVEPRPGPAMVLFQAATQRSFEEALSLAARAGAWKVYPLHADRCRSGKNPKIRPERWKAIAAQAGEIARDLYGTAVGTGVTLTEALAICSEEGLAPVLLSPSGPAPLLSVRLLTEMDNCDADNGGVAGTCGLPRPKGVALFVGPEGGFTASEESLALQAGAFAVTLGDRVIPADSAGGFAIFTLIQAFRARMSGSAT